MSGAIPLLPLYAFMAWTGTTVPLSYREYICEGKRVKVEVKGEGHPRTGHEGPEGE